MRIEEIMQDVSNRFQQANLYYGHGTDNPDDEAFALVCMALDLPFDEAILDRDLSEKEEQKLLYWLINAFKRESHYRT